MKIKNYLWLAFAALAVTVGCTEDEAITDGVLDVIEAEMPTVTLTDTSDDDAGVYSVDAVITAPEGTLYYSYYLAEGDVDESVAASSIYNVSYTGLAQGIVKYANTATTSFSVENLSMATTYTLYAVAGNEQGTVSEIATISVTTAGVIEEPEEPEEPEDPEDPEDGAITAYDVAGTYTMAGYSYFDEVTYEETFIISAIDDSTLSISGMFYGYSEVTVTATFDAATCSIAIPDWQNLGTFTFTGYGDYDVYFANALDYDDIVFTHDGDMVFSSDSSQWWGYYIDSLGWYDVYSSSTLTKTSDDNTGGGDDNTGGDGSDAYNTWLGTWNLTSTSLSETGTPFTLEIVITEDVADSSYSIYGFDLTTGRNDFAMPATFDATTGGWGVAAENTVGTYDNTYTMMYLSYAWIGGAYQSYYIITGDFEALTASIGSDGSTGSIACGSGTITSGDTFDVATVRLFAYYGGTYYNFYNDTDNLAVTDSDFLIGPFTLAKVSDSTTVSASTSSAKSIAERTFVSKFANKATYKNVSAPKSFNSTKNLSTKVIK